MKIYQVRKYEKESKMLWNEFVKKAKNATFLFDRDFMEYHQDRFEDYSLLVFDAKENVKAVFPANKAGDTVFSHQGLTYGGLVVEKKTKSEEIFTIMDSIVRFLRAQGIITLQMKSLPIIYNSTMSNELDFYFFKSGANCFRKDLNLAFPLKDPELWSKSKWKHYKKTKNIEVRFDNKFNDFWEEILIPRLLQKYNASPVHTLQEIESLASDFPENIKQVNAYIDNQIVAGITLFQDTFVVKSQYGATSDLGEKNRALDYLYFTLFEHFRAENKLYFDMGVVTDTSFKEGFNKGLLQQKEELGGVVFCQDYYQLDLQVK
ncbi:FemAB family protein [Flavobacterium sp. NRK F10]|uniref:FemAB family protein n=1 Tax=Flavobacterium sp. NRK F10 TaxID=2954931 RepID=UPI00209161B6|nr:FemAB family protein [Flavobacterium sp. NRK F10]MCO6173753.1 FemAB family protein [Flavobacterium sp. NRK F10]